ncbi:hypothetical protein KR215_010983 [Drosophila sulfurigaster]|nr:hypothetical protein KR215_010983 [Drosophila sulfurigaster]
MPHKRKTHKIHVKTVQTQLHAAPKVCVKSNHGSELENTLSPPRPALREVPSSTTGNLFAVPQSNTTIRKHEELNALQNMRAVVDSNLTPRSKAAIAPKVTVKMNFAPNVAIFKNLTPLNVNDTLSNWEVSKPSKPIPKTEQPEPVLNQYVETIKPVERFMPEPALQLEFPYDDYDFLQAYKKMYTFK